MILYQDYIKQIRLFPLNKNHSARENRDFMHQQQADNKFLAPICSI